MNRKVEIHVVDSLDNIRARTNGTVSPATTRSSGTSSWSALQDTGCAWREPAGARISCCFKRDGEFAGAMPLYLKKHSRGEYVFDHAWADAFERNGLRYYPKGLSGVPFSPVTGPRLIAATHEERVMLARGAIELTKQLELSSLHVLFPQEQDLEALTEAATCCAKACSFTGKICPATATKSFDAFLATMSHDKRKKVKQDRRRVADAGVTYTWLRGEEIDEARSISSTTVMKTPIASTGIRRICRANFSAGSMRPRPTACCSSSPKRTASGSRAR